VESGVRVLSRCLRLRGGLLLRSGRRQASRRLRVFSAVGSELTGGVQMSAGAGHATVAQAGPDVCGC